MAIILIRNFHQCENWQILCRSVGKFSVGDDHDIHIFEESELYCVPGGCVWKLPDAKSTLQILNEFVNEKKSISSKKPC